MSVPEGCSYEFGDFRVDATRRLLLRRGEPVSVTPRVFDTLLYMTRHAGKVLDKNELMSAIWPDSFVEENNLNQNVSALRRVLGESRGENRYIATEPGRGYRFVADVKVVDVDARAPAASEPSPLRAKAAGVPSVAPARPRRTLSARSALLGIASLGAAIALIGGFGWWERNPRVQPRPAGTMAVLPFKPLVRESRDESLEMGIADTLIARLSNIRNLKVRPLSAVRRFGGQEQDPIVAGRELGVDVVLDGRIQRRDDRIRVTARLVRVHDGKQLWAGQFNETLTDIFSVQDSISARVTGELALPLNAEESELLAKQYTHNAHAYELYLRGRFFLGQLKRASLMKAIGFLEDAVDQDPDYALAYAALAECYTRLPATSDVPSRDAFPKAKQAALRALEIDPQLVEARTILAWVALWYEWDWTAAENEFRAALQINPNHAFAHMGYGHLLSDLGRHDEALREGDAALTLDPISFFGNMLKGHLLYQARRYPEAMDRLRRSLELEPHYWLGQITLGKVYERSRQYEDALDAFRKARELSEGMSEPISLSGYTYAVSGRREEAERTLRELEAKAARTYVPPHYLALVHLGLGNSTEALKWLERAYEERDVHMVFLGVEPKWDPLRGDPRFISIVKRMALQRSP